MQPVNKYGSSWIFFLKSTKECVVVAVVVGHRQYINRESSSDDAISLRYKIIIIMP